MKIEKVKVSAIKPNPKNPRIIKDDKFKKLVKSIESFPEMLELRPIVVSDEMTVLGGNMRLRALQSLGIAETFIVRASSLTPEQQREFIVKDNVGFGEWDWGMIANEWDDLPLEEWGMDTTTLLSENIDLDKFFKEDTTEKESKNKILLEYTGDDYNKVLEAFKKYDKTKEQVVWDLLGL